MPALPNACGLADSPVVLRAGRAVPWICPLYHPPRKRPKVRRPELRVVPFPVGGRYSNTKLAVPHSTAPGSDSIRLGHIQTQGVAFCGRKCVLAGVPRAEGGILLVRPPPQTVHALVQLPMVTGALVVAAVSTARPRVCQTRGAYGRVGSCLLTPARWSWNDLSRSACEGARVQQRPIDMFAPLVA